MISEVSLYTKTIYKGVGGLCLFIQDSRNILIINYYNMKDKQYLDIKFIHKYFPNTLENIRWYRELKHWNIDELEKRYLIECLRLNQCAMQEDLDKLLN